MNRFEVGDKVLFSGMLGVVKGIDSYEDEFSGFIDEEEVEYEYAVEFVDTTGLDNLYGCVDGDTLLVEKGKGSWIMEEYLEAAE